MKMVEPSLETIEDYEGKESIEKRLSVWIVILSGLLIGAVYGIIHTHGTYADQDGQQVHTGIIKY
ncbi:MAG: hypothetical protein IE885_08510 [Campylobacterales bacterium]|nr:hypothetical protein [Campylobacterales bacterium]